MLREPIETATMATRGSAAQAFQALPGVSAQPGSRDVAPASVAEMQELCNIHRRVAANAASVAFSLIRDSASDRVELEAVRSQLESARCGLPPRALQESMRRLPARDETWSCSSDEEEAADVASCVSQLCAGQLIVTVRSAGDLKDLNMGVHAMSPYASVTIGAQALRTEEHESGGQYPSWNEAMRFFVEPTTTPTADISVFNASYFGGRFGLSRNQMIGHAVVSFAHIIRPAGPRRDTVVATILGKTHGHKHGLVKLDLEFQPADLSSAHGSSARDVPKVLAAGYECDVDGQHDARDDGSADQLQLLSISRSLGRITLPDEDGAAAKVKVLRGQGIKQVIEDITLPASATVVSVGKKGNRMRARTRTGAMFRVGGNSPGDEKRIEAGTRSDLGVTNDGKDPDPEDESGNGLLQGGLRLGGKLLGAVGAVASLDGVRGVVSKKKRRFQEDGFDLDLTYITDQIVAMGFPAEYHDGSALFRNPMEQVVQFFARRHRNKALIVNLCSEREYSTYVLYPTQTHRAKSVP